MLTDTSHYKLLELGTEECPPHSHKPAITTMEGFFFCHLSSENLVVNTSQVRTQRPIRSGRLSHSEHLLPGHSRTGSH